MKRYILKFLIMCVLAVIGAILEGYFKSRDINVTYAIYLTIGYINCLIVNDFFTK